LSFQRRVKRAGSGSVGRLIRGPGGRAALLTLATFVLGYTISARWLFPSEEDPTQGDFTEIPDLSGVPLDVAVTRARDLGLEARSEGALHHPEMEAGSVIAQSPLPGQVARPGDTLHLTLSAGPESRLVPDLVGLAGDEGATLLRRSGFDVDIIRSRLPARAGVIETRPAAGTRLALPATVELVIAEGAAIVVVPDLRGRHVDDVEAILEEGQLRLGSIRYQVDAPEGPGRVVSQSPAPNSSLRGDGFVSVVVAGTPPDSVNADLTEETDPPRPDTLGTAPPGPTTGSGG